MANEVNTNETNATNTETTPKANTEPNTTETNSENQGNNSKPKTEAELRAEIEKEIKAEYEKIADKRVTDAVKTANAKWKKEAEREKLSEEEKRKLEEQEKAAENARKEHELTIKGLRLDVVDAVAELGLDAGFRNLIAVDDLALISDESERKEKLTERIKGMKTLFDAEVKKQVEKEKREFLKGTTPPASKGKKETTLYDEAKKAGNAKGMLSAKLGEYFSGDE